MYDEKFYELYMTGMFRKAWFESTLDNIQRMIGAIEQQDPEHKDVHLYEAQTGLIDAYASISKAELFLRQALDES